MKQGSIHFEGNQLYSVRGVDPIDLKHIEYMYVKYYDKQAKIKRSGLISGIASAVLFMLHPIVGLVIFPVIFTPLYLKSPSYELRVFISNNSGFGSKEISFHRSNFRDEYDEIIEKVKARKQS
ncbi:hypothetical protein L4D20_12070 [Vibrio kyushuensis]|uniref:hypothetical protein n=1 Tax=Vibrio kyushuensis TaxID=2910249 RepID=UPI003D0CF4E3